MKEGDAVNVRSTLVLAAVLALATGAAAAPAPPIEIQHFKYLPPTVTVPPGTTVRWVNHDEETHAVTSSTGLFASAGLDHEQTFEHTFARPGTYTYFCALHPQMRATVVVKGD
jgi:plastocyanin